MLQRGLQSCRNLQEVCKGVCKVAAICRRSAKGFAKLPQFAGGLQRGLQSCRNLQEVCKGVCKVVRDLWGRCKGVCKVAAICKKFAKGFARRMKFVLCLK
ncbi:hypothetical protein B5F77_12535 [Parabacteroides sp. An277]|nr:hypothetical protein B5F77_12535 [Parabacteroides sp. An277]